MRRTLEEVIGYLGVEPFNVQMIRSHEEQMDEAFSEIFVIGVSTDSRKITRDQLFVPIVGDNFDGHQFREMAWENGSLCSLWNKQTPLPNTPGIYILVDDTLSSLQTLAREYRNSLAIKVIAITGSNGKTTSKDLIASVLSQSHKVHKTSGNLNNHLGVPLTLLAIDQQDEYAVIEMGMSNVGEIALLTKIASPDIGIVTNIGESHLGFLGSKEKIAAAKFELLAAMDKGIAILNLDDEMIEQQIQFLDHHHPRHDRLQIVTFAINNERAKVSVRLLEAADDLFGRSRIHVKGEYPQLDDAFIISTPGVHNIYNALTAIIAGSICGLSTKIIQQGLDQAVITPMRMEISKVENSYIINDAYNASPTSMKAAITYISTINQPIRKGLLLADMLDLGEESDQFHLQIGQFLLDKQLFAYGNKAKNYIEPFQAIATETKVQFFDREQGQELRHAVKEELSKNCILLLKGSRGMRLETFIDDLHVDRGRR